MDLKEAFKDAKGYATKENAYRKIEAFKETLEKEHISYFVLQLDSGR